MSSFFDFFLSILLDLSLNIQILTYKNISCRYVLMTEKEPPYIQKHFSVDFSSGNVSSLSFAAVSISFFHGYPTKFLWNPLSLLLALFSRESKTHLLYHCPHSYNHYNYTIILFICLNLFIFLFRYFRINQYFFHKFLNHRFDIFHFLLPYSLFKMNHHIFILFRLSYAGLKLKQKWADFINGIKPKGLFSHLTNINIIFILIVREFQEYSNIYQGGYKTVWKDILPHNYSRVW